MRKTKKGFTLIELLVVVLIIGILSAIALPQYKLAVEKAKMTEAVMLVRKIAEMHRYHYMINGQYLGARDIDKLDITIPGSKNSEGRLVTKDFVYSPTVCTNVCDGTTPYLAYAKRLSNSGDSVNGPFPYVLFIQKNEPQKIVCSFNSLSSRAQERLCNRINNYNSLD